VVHPAAPVRTEPLVEVPLESADLGGGGRIGGIDSPSGRRASVRVVEDLSRLPQDAVVADQHRHGGAAAGPAHAQEFTVEVVVGADRLGMGRGSSRQRAEEEAAEAALAVVERRSEEPA